MERFVESDISDSSDISESNDRSDSNDIDNEFDDRRISMKLYQENILFESIIY